MAAFMLDVPLSIERGIVSVSDVDEPLDEMHRGGRHWSVFSYVHDRWQIRPNITLDLGLRHEFCTPVVGFHGTGGMATYDHTTNQLLVAGYGGIPENLGVKNYWKNFNPRTGISWRLNDSNVVRAGYGVSAEGGPSLAGQIYPISQSQLIEGPNSFAPAGSLATGIPALAVVPIPESGVLPATGTLLTQSLSNILTEPHHNGQLHSWNVAYQRIMPAGFTAEVAYVGNRAKDDWSGEISTRAMSSAPIAPGNRCSSSTGRTASTTVQVQTTGLSRTITRCS